MISFDPKHPVREDTKAHFYLKNSEKLSSIVVSLIMKSMVEDGVIDKLVPNPEQTALIKQGIGLLKTEHPEIKAWYNDSKRKKGFTKIYLSMFYPNHRLDQTGGKALTFSQEDIMALETELSRLNKTQEEPSFDPRNTGVRATQNIFDAILDSL